MKKLLLYSLFLSITLLACGPNEEERAKEQAENAAIVDRKVNEIMDQLEQERKAQIIVGDQESDVTDSVDY